MHQNTDPEEYKTRLNIALQWIRHELAKLYTTKEPDIVPGFNLAKAIKAFWSQKINGHFHEFVMLNLNWLTDEIRATHGSENAYSFQIRKTIILETLLSGNELPEFIKLSEDENEYFQTIKQSLMHPELEIKAPLYTPASKLIIDDRYDITACIQVLNRIAVLEHFCDSIAAIRDLRLRQGQEFIINFISVEQWFEDQVCDIEIFLKKLIENTKSIEIEQAYQHRRPESLRAELQGIQETVRFARQDYHQHMARGFNYFDRENHARISNELSRLYTRMINTENDIHRLSVDVRSIKIIAKFPEPKFENIKQPTLRSFAWQYLLEWITLTPSDRYFNYRFYKYDDFNKASCDDTLFMTHIKLARHFLSSATKDYQTFWNNQIKFIKTPSAHKDIRTLLEQAIPILLKGLTIPFILLLPLIGLTTLFFKKSKELFRMQSRDSLLPYIGMIACDLFASAIEIGAGVGVLYSLYILTQSMDFPTFLAIPISLLSPIAFPISLLLFGVNFGPLNACFAIFAGGLSVYFTALSTTKILYGVGNFAINSIFKPLYNFTKNNIYGPIKELLFSGFQKCGNCLNTIESNIMNKFIGQLSGDVLIESDACNLRGSTIQPALLSSYNLHNNLSPNANIQGDDEIQINNTSDPVTNHHHRPS